MVMRPFVKCRIETTTTTHPFVEQGTAGATTSCRKQRAKGKPGRVEEEEEQRLSPSLAKTGREVGGRKETPSLVGRRLVADFTPITSAEWRGVTNYSWSPSPLHPTLATGLPIRCHL